MAGKIIDQLEAGMPSGALRLKAQIMAARDVGAAYQWAQNLSSPEERATALSSVLYEASVYAPADVLDLARDTDLGPEKQAVIRRIALRWSDTHREEAVEWMVDQPEDVLGTGQ